MQASKIEATTRIDILRDAGVPYYEEILRGLPKSIGEDFSLRIASHQSADLFADVWAAIVVGTICRRSHSKIKATVWGKTELGLESNFTSSLAGLAALQLTHELVNEENQYIDFDEIEFDISVKNRGILGRGSGKTRLLVEFDPQHSIAQLLEASNLQSRALLFRNLVLMFRKDLEYGHRSRGLEVRDQDEVGSLTTFLSELHTNAYKYNRDVIPGLRIVRLRAHRASGRRDELFGRTSGLPILQEYLEGAISGRGSHGVMEANVSDFGHGILDHFLHSGRGTFYRKRNRREVLHHLIHRNLSSSSSPSAGHGLPNVLRSAKALKAFVSLRTAEFWLAQTFASGATNFELEDVSSTPHAPVVGTHWQFLWPMAF